MIFLVLSPDIALLNVSHPPRNSINGNECKRCALKDRMSARGVNILGSKRNLFFLGWKYLGFHPSQNIKVDYVKDQKMRRFNDSVSVNKLTLNHDKTEGGSPLRGQLYGL